MTIKKWREVYDIEIKQWINDVISLVNPFSNATTSTDTTGHAEENQRTISMGL